MKGLIKKDLLLIKGNVKVFVIMLIIFLGISLNGEDSMLSILPIISVMLSITTFSYDEYNKWDAYAISLPQSRKNIVKSKYVTAIILMVFSTIVTLAIGFIVGLIKNNINVEELIGSVVGVMFASSLIISIMYPVMYKLGCEKGRVVLFVFAFLFSGAAGVIAMRVGEGNLNVSNVLAFLDKYGFYILTGVSILGMYISCKISEKVYSKKDF